MCVISRLNVLALSLFCLSPSLPLSPQTTSPSEAADGSKILCTRVSETGPKLVSLRIVSLYCIHIYIYVHGHHFVHVCHTLCQQDSTPPTPTPTVEPSRPTNNDFDNCKQLDPSLSLAWTVDRSSESVQFMLCGCTASDISQ